MIKYCPFDERYRCYIWIDNEVLRYAQQESEELFVAFKMWCKTQVSHHIFLSTTDIGKASFPLDHRKS